MRIDKITFTKFGKKKGVTYTRPPKAVMPMAPYVPGPPQDDDSFDDCCGYTCKDWKQYLDLNKGNSCDDDRGPKKYMGYKKAKSCPFVSQTFCKKPLKEHCKKTCA